MHRSPARPANSWRCAHASVRITESFLDRLIIVDLYFLLEHMYRENIWVLVGLEIVTVSVTMQHESRFHAICGYMPLLGVWQTTCEASSTAQVCIAHSDGRQKDVGRGSP